MTPSKILPYAALLTLLFLLSPSTTNATGTVVRDMNGHPLQEDTDYLAIPVVRGQGGGLNLAPTNNTVSCPLLAVQEKQEVSPGLDLKFYPLNYPTEKRITLSTDLNIEFDATVFCSESTWWRLSFDEATGRRYVGIGGVIGSPGVQTLSNWFKIEEAGSGKYDYKLVFCPTVCNFCKVVCGDIGVLSGKNGTRFLGITDKPLLLRFKKDGPPV